MKVIDCIQGSDQWLNVRRGVATASNFSKIVTSKGDASTQRNGYTLQLASELITDIQDESYKSSDMQRGNDLEAEARQAYMEATLSNVEQVGFILCDHYGYSPDGLVGNDGIIEIKCPKQNTHTKYLFDKKLPTEYKAQVQGGLLATGRKWCDFISYHPSFDVDKRLLIIRAERDEDFISSLKAALDKVNDKKTDILSKICKTA